MFHFVFKFYLYQPSEIYDVVTREVFALVTFNFGY